jgi:uncharacterized membrane protein YebE (DUF533 family)
MSFVRTLATLAAGFAAAKGFEKYQKMGGMAGVQKSVEGNPALSNMQAQMGAMLEKMGVPGGAKAFQEMAAQWSGATQQAGESAMAGLGGLMAALGGAAATGTEQAGQMMDTLTGNKATTGTMEENAKLMIRAMIQAAKADGEIDDEEKSRILGYLGDLEPEEKAFVEAELAKPIDVNALAMDTGQQAKAQVYAMSAMAIRVDTQSEASYLDGLAAALGLSDADRKRIHTTMGLG